MGRNWKDICSFNSSMKQYVPQGVTKENWLTRQVQGKGYEYDWMDWQRMMLENFFKTFDAGDVPNKLASDVTERCPLAGKSKEYQMKAYTKGNASDLKNTPKDMTVIINAEKTSVMEKKAIMP